MSVSKILKFLIISEDVASSAYGIARATLDIDIIADLRLQHINSLVKSLESQYYISAEAIKEAVINSTSSNLIHLETMIKIDIFILKDEPFDKVAFERKQCDNLDEDFTKNFYLSSPEDIILSKLDWYKKGGKISDQQWKDILGVMKVQEKRLDLQYLKQWAHELNLSKLLSRALMDAGIKINSLLFRYSF